MQATGLSAAVRSVLSADRTPDILVQPAMQTYSEAFRAGVKQAQVVMLGHYYSKP
jgi:hypothetical protein